MWKRIRFGKKKKKNVHSKFGMGQCVQDLEALVSNCLKNQEVPKCIRFTGPTLK